MNCEQAIAFVHSHSRFSDQPGLARLKRLLAVCGNPQEKLPFLHIAGTNGKGSTAVMTASMLCASGYRTGLTVSPYILDFRERIQVNGEMIAPQALADAVEIVRQAADGIDGLVEFEIVTAAAFVHFARAGCDIAVAEVGLGGRLDATNVIPPPIAAAITAISLDHTAILGETLEQIAAEKCGILKRGTAAVLSPGQPPSVIETVRRQCAAAGCPLRELSLTELDGVTMNLAGSGCRYKGQELLIPLAGEHQLQNALTALALCEEAASRGFSRLNAEAMAVGLAAARIPVRFERVADTPPVYLDGAHNPGGAAALAALLALAEAKPIGVIGMLSDKDSAAALATLSPCFHALVCTTVSSPRALDAAVLAQRARAAGCERVLIKEQPEQALALAREIAIQESRVVVACGSLYLAAELRASSSGK